MNPTNQALRLTAAYAVVAGLWIVATDAVTHFVFTTPVHAAAVQSTKGIVFVLVTSGVLFMLLRRYFTELSKEALAREEILIDEKREVGRVVARTLAHDVRNVMAILRSNFDFLAIQAEDEASREAIADVDQALGDLNHLINRLQESASSPSEFAPFDLRDVVTLCARIMRSDNRLGDVAIEVETPDEPVEIIGREVMLRQALINLIVNAAEAGATRVTIILEHDEDEGFGTLRVVDDGPGMSPEVLDRAFEPFFSTKGRGSGLGLLSVRHQLQTHGGSIELANLEEGGLQIDLDLPLAPLATGRDGH